MESSTPDGSITDFVCELEKETNKDEINAAMKKASRGNNERNSHLLQIL
ncbi:MAG: hypothetical protein R3A12_12455 [Ignavibacteria bacterium]